MALGRLELPCEDRVRGTQNELIPAFETRKVLVRISGLFAALSSLPPPSLSRHVCLSVCLSLSRTPQESYTGVPSSSQSRRCPSDCPTIPEQNYPSERQVSLGGGNSPEKAGARGRRCLGVLLSSVAPSVCYLDLSVCSCDSTESPRAPTASSAVSPAEQPLELSV